MSENSKEILEQFKTGDKQAANHLFEQYFDRSVKAASRRIANRPIDGVDSEDVALSAFESMWKRADKMQFSETDLQDSNEFWKLLCTVIRFKAEKHIRRANAEKRGAGKVAGESVFMQGNDSSSVSPGIAGCEGNGLNAEELALLKEQHATLMGVLDNDEMREVATMRMEDFKVAEIAQHFDKSEKWVQRRLALIRQTWKQELDK